MLKIETYHNKILNESKLKLSESVSMQSILDFISTPRASVVECEISESNTKNERREEMCLGFNIKNAYLSNIPEICLESGKWLKNSPKNIKSNNKHLKSLEEASNHLGEDLNSVEKESYPLEKEANPLGKDKNLKEKNPKPLYKDSQSVKNDSNSLRKDLNPVKKEDNTNESPLMAGAELCKILLNLYNINDIQSSIKKTNIKKRVLIVNTLTGLLCVSQEAKRFALKKGLLEIVMKQLADIHVKLSLESVDCLRRVADKRRVLPLLQELNGFIGLMTNFLIGCSEVKKAASNLGLADICHKLWVWICTQKDMVVDVLKMFCTFTNDCVVG